MKRLSSPGTPRLRQSIVGLIGITLFFSLTTIGIQYAFGYFDDEYELYGSFAAAGQGLAPQSDVKIRGVNIGEVRGVELVDGRALVTMDIDRGERVPATASAVIRPKTLFGEKFVDIVPGDAEIDGPFLADGDEITDTLGGFELEQVLSDLHPVLRAIDPAELLVVLGELADAGDGLGPQINRTITNFQALTAVYRDNDANTRQLLDDLSLLTDELARRAPDLVGAARDLNVALPPLNRRGDQLAVVLDQAARLSRDLADVLDDNRQFIRTSIGPGGDGLQALYDKRSNIRPTLVGLRQYLQVISESVGIDIGDGTKMARVKGIAGGDPCGKGEGVECLLPGPGDEPPTGSDDPSSDGPRPLIPGPGLPPVPGPTEGTDAITRLLEELLG